MQAAVLTIVPIVVGDFSQFGTALFANVEVGAAFSYGNFNDDLGRFLFFNHFFFCFFRQCRSRQISCSGSVA